MAGQRALPSLLPVFFALSLTTTLAKQQSCSSGKELGLSMAYSTNDTGHRTFIAQLEQPVAGPGWLLNVDVNTSGCEPGDVPRRTLTISLNGPPVGGPPAPLPSPSPTPPAPRPGPPGYLTLPGLGHFRSPPEAKNWYEAREFCRKEGGKLWAPASQLEAEVLLKHFAPNATGAHFSDSFWNSATDMGQKGKYVTEDGVPIEHTNFSAFYSGRPVNSYPINCLLTVTNKRLYDYDCNSKMTFICKVPL